jgi:uncharacterized protein (DUF58 family)
VPNHRHRHLGRVLRPTRSAALLLLLALILELLGRLIGSTGVTLAAAAAVGAVLSDALLTPGVDIGALQRRTPARMAVGIPAPVRITVDAHIRRRHGSRRPVVLIDHPPGLEPGRVVTPMLSNGRQAVAERLATPLHRGCWSDGGTITIEAFSPLGGFVRRKTIRMAAAGWVHPAPCAPLRLPDPTFGSAEGSALSRRRGLGTDVLGIREWRPGDPATAIHWRASARRNSLIVLERELPGGSALVVAVGAGDGEHFEDDLARTAATAGRALRSGRVVALVAGSRATTVTRPRELLDWFAAVGSTDPPEPAALQAALRTARPGATLLWLGTGEAPATVVQAARAAAVGAIVNVAALTSGPVR